MTTRTRHRLALVTAALLLAFGAAGCGGGSKSPSVANVDGANSGSRNAGPGGTANSEGAKSTSSGGGGGFGLTMKGPNATKFASCMRSHGVPNFPDPDSSGSVSIGSDSGIDPRSPKFQAAQKACEKDMPKGPAPSPEEQAKAKAAALAFSACMRSHGVPKFPDPVFSDGKTTLQLNGGPGSGLDPSSPKFKAAQEACRSKLPGGGPGTVKGTP
jgi:hypothetical protein